MVSKLNGPTAPCVVGHWGMYLESHRRRMKTEEKAKFAAVWGTEFIQFLVALAILHQDNFEEYDEFILFFKSTWCNSSYSSICPIAK